MKLYNDYNSYLRSKYGCKVYRIGLDAGFTCPNRDGTKGLDGCIYCNQSGSRSPYTNAVEPIEQQLEKRIKYLKEKFLTEKFIAYFQAFTNTYAPLHELKSKYDKILPFKEIVGLSIGTRPDAVDREKLELIASYSAKYEVWVEYGLQSIHDDTLRCINRGHTFDDFLTALNLTRQFALPVSVHIILGLPGETKDKMLETARHLSDLKIDAVKIHLLHILKGSPLEKLYKEKKIKLLEQDEYVELVCDFLENLSEDVIVQRLTGEGSGEDHIAPAWAFKKQGTINKIEEELKRRDSRQGKSS